MKETLKNLIRNVLENFETISELTFDEKGNVEENCSLMQLIASFFKLPEPEIEAFLRRTLRKKEPKFVKVPAFVQTWIHLMAPAEEPTETNHVVLETLGIDPEDYFKAIDAIPERVSQWNTSLITIMCKDTDKFEKLMNRTWIEKDADGNAVPLKNISRDTLEKWEGWYYKQLEREEKKAKKSESESVSE